MATSYSRDLELVGSEEDAEGVRWATYRPVGEIKINDQQESREQRSPRDRQIRPRRTR